MLVRCTFHSVQAQSRPHCADLTSQAEHNGIAEHNNTPTVQLCLYELSYHSASTQLESNFLLFSNW